MQFRRVLFSLVLALSMVGVACGGDDPENLGGQGGEVGAGGSGGTDVGEGGSGGTDVGEGGAGGTDVGEGGTGGTDVGEGGSGGTDVGEGGTGGTDVGEGGTGGSDGGAGGEGGSEEPVVEVGSVEIVFPASCSVIGSSCTAPEVGAIYQLAVTVLDIDGEPLPDEEVVWTSSDLEIATAVDGLVSVIGEGTATITATAGDVSDSFELTSSWALVYAITLGELDSGPMEVDAGQTITLAAYGLKPGGRGMPPQPSRLAFPIWEVSDPSKIEIVEELNDGGSAIVLRGVEAGTVTVTVRARDEQVPAALEEEGVSTSEALLIR